MLKIFYSYIQDEYGELLANNLLIFASKFIIQKLEAEELNFKINNYMVCRLAYCIFYVNFYEMENCIKHKTV